MSDIYIKRDGTEVEITDANRDAIYRQLGLGRGSLKSSGLQQPAQANAVPIKPVKRQPKDPIISEAELNKKLDEGSDPRPLYNAEEAYRRQNEPGLEHAENVSSPFSMVGAGIGALGTVALSKAIPRLLKGLKYGFTPAGKIAKVEANAAKLLKGAQTDHTAAIINKETDNTIAKITRDELLGVTKQTPTGSLLSEAKGMSMWAVPGAVAGGYGVGYLEK